MDTVERKDGLGSRYSICFRITRTGRKTSVCRKANAFMGNVLEWFTNEKPLDFHWKMGDNLCIKGGHVDSIGSLILGILANET